MPRANLPQSKAVFHCLHVRRQAHHAPHRVWTLEIYLDVEIRSNVLDVTTTLDIWLDVIWGIPLNISLSVIVVDDSLNVLLGVTLEHVVSLGAVASLEVISLRNDLSEEEKHH